MCECQNFEVGQVVAFQNCRVSDYNGKSLNGSSNPSDITMNASHKRFIQLKNWVSGMKNDLSSAKAGMKALSAMSGSGSAPEAGIYTLGEMVEAATIDPELQSGEKAGYYTVNCYCSWVFVPENAERQLFYLACPSCKKKVVDDEESFRCERCQKSYDAAVPTYNFTVKVSDLSATISLQCLGEVGQAFIGIACNDLYHIREDPEQIKAHVNGTILKQMQLVIRARMDTSEFASQSAEGSSFRYTLVRAAPFEFKTEADELLKRLAIYKKKF